MFAREQFDASAWVPPAKAKSIAQETLRVCDALDGTEDGVISNYMGCYKRLDQSMTKDPMAGIRCPGGADTGNDCLSDAQMAVVNSIRAPSAFGFPMSNGEMDWPGMPAGMEDRGWILWQAKPTPETSNQNNVNRILVERAKGKYDVATASLEELRPLIQTMSEQLDPKADWTTFIKHGGKLILHTAATDYTSNDRATIRYYEAVVKHHGQQAVDRMSRFYVTPNANHGSTGFSAKTGEMLPHYVNLLGMLEDWVENGVTPPDAPVQRLMDRKAPYTVMSSRPLCRFPKYPRYTGTGDAKQADNYVCTNP
jgi:feruloyl esterase